MKKDKFNTKFRDYARTLSPQSDEQGRVSDVYASIQELLGENNCLQVGSYPRFTAITPVHDLDLLYFLGEWNVGRHDPMEALENLRSRIEEEYENPTEYGFEVSLQTHSVTISFIENGEEVFAVDIVPAYVFSTNEFGDDTYMVPEVMRKKHKNRAAYYQALSKQRGEMGWIVSDPRGYIKVASGVDSETGGEFRKTAKIIKKWKNNLVEADENLKLKSFHLEQVVTQYFQAQAELDIFDAIFKFFVELPKIIDKPNQIKDRANNDKFIDDYLADFTDEQKAKIKDARDNFLIKLENFHESASVEQLLDISFSSRILSEKFLFDFGIKTLVDHELLFGIDGFVKQTPGFSAGWIKETPQLQNGITSGNKKRKIEYSVRKGRAIAEEYRWKVKNSDESREPRGEITKGGTKNNPETTLFPSRSFVECYAVDDNICIAKARVRVNIV